MKTKAFLVALSAICFATVSFAQEKFNVQNKTKTEFYNDLETAIQKAVAGDTIYLPGKVIQVQNDVIIDKKLTIIGAGCDIDSIGGLQPTEIKRKSDGAYATINFRNGSDGSLLMGCIAGTIQFGHYNENGESQQNIQNVTIFRNKINAIYLGVDGSNNQVNNVFIKENQVGEQIWGFGTAVDCSITNNLVNSVGGGKNFYISNNVIWGQITGGNACRFENNFIIGLFFFPYSFNNCIFNNNAFVGIVTFPDGNYNNGDYNLIGQSGEETFEVNDFNYPKNLKIRADSDCKNKGTDGTDIGIFGGPAPFKAGAVPFNPHIDKAVITGQTDKDGKIKVDIQVSAQTR